MNVRWTLNPNGNFKMFEIPGNNMEPPTTKTKTVLTLFKIIYD